MGPIAVKLYFPGVDVIKLFFGENLDFPKIKKWKKFVLMSDPALKC